MVRTSKLRLWGVTGGCFFLCLSILRRKMCLVGPALGKDDLLFDRGQICSQQKTQKIFSLKTSCLSWHIKQWKSSCKCLFCEPLISVDLCYITKAELYDTFRLSFLWQNIPLSVLATVILLLFFLFLVKCFIVLNHLMKQPNILSWLYTTKPSWNMSKYTLNLSFPS